MNLILTLILAALPQNPVLPLPDATTFLRDLPRIIFITADIGEMSGDSTLQFDSEPLRQYTYTERETRISLDGKGKPNRTDVDVYHVVRGLNGWQSYRKLISRNGVPLTKAEPQKQDK